MAVSPKSDQVFQLSLTEIAFTLVFILLLLLGSLVVREQTARQAAEVALADAQKLASTTQSLERAKVELEQALSTAGTIPEKLEETISRLSETQQLKAEKEKLFNQVEDLDAKLTAMIELKSALESAAQREDVLEEEILTALTLQSEARKAVKDAQGSSETSEGKLDRGIETSPDEALQIVREALATSHLLKSSFRDQLGKALPPGQEAQMIKELVTSARLQSEAVKNAPSINAARKENADLRGQVAFYKRRLEARGGRDFPPCWTTESGSPEFLFSVELTPSGVMTLPSWPAHREADARGLPGLDAALQSPQSLESFVRSVQGIFNASKRADPQCRHFVLLKSTIAEAVASDRARLTVENYFYKSEARR